MVIVDTTVWVDYFNDVATSQTIWLDQHLTDQRLGTVRQQARHQPRQHDPIVFSNL